MDDTQARDLTLGGAADAAALGRICCPLVLSHPVFDAPAVMPPPLSAARSAAATEMLRPHDRIVHIKVSLLQLSEEIR